MTEPTADDPLDDLPVLCQPSDAEGEPTIAARDEILSFFTRRLTSPGKRIS